MIDWECPAPGWFVLWGMELAAKENPRKSIAVFDGDRAVCGFVPNDWDGERIYLETKCPIG
jgi:hypothetical protein